MGNEGGEDMKPGTGGAWGRDKEKQDSHGVTIRNRQNWQVSTATALNVIHGKRSGFPPAPYAVSRSRSWPWGAQGGEKRRRETVFPPGRAYWWRIPTRLMRMPLAPILYGKSQAWQSSVSGKRILYDVLYLGPIWMTFSMVMECGEVEGVITPELHKNDCDKIAGLLKRPVVPSMAVVAGNVPNIVLTTGRGNHDRISACMRIRSCLCVRRKDHGVDHVRYLGCQAAARSG